MIRTVLAAALLHTTHALAPPAQALRTLAKTSGDDVRGITSPEAENALLPESAYFVGLGFRAWLGDEQTPIFVGRDPRASSDSIGEAFCRGASALDAGPATTPAMLESLLRGDSKACGACMVTASHLPPEWNGLKLFSAKEQRGLNKKEVKEVLGLAADLADMMEPVAGDITSAELCGNQPVRRVRSVERRGTGIATPSSRRRVDGVEERAVKY